MPASDSGPRPDPAGSLPDDAATPDLLPLVYDELRRLARSHLRSERSDHTLSPTALVHEAYERLAAQQVRWQNRSHFLGVAALAMRRILVHHARRRAAAKRGGGVVPVTLVEDRSPHATPDEELVALDEALDRLAGVAERPARVVELRFFGGLTQEETAGVLGVSVPTVQRDWQTARAWLGSALGR